MNWLKNVVQDFNQAEGVYRLVFILLCSLLCVAVIPIFAYFWIWYAVIGLVVNYIISPIFYMGTPMRLLLAIFGFLSVAVIAGVMNTNHTGILDIVFWPYPIIYEYIYNVLWNRFYGFGDNGEMTIVMIGVYVLCGLLMTISIIIYSKIFKR